MPLCTVYHPSKAGPRCMQQECQARISTAKARLLFQTSVPFLEELWLKAQRQQNKSSSWGCSQGCTHSNTFSFSIPGRAVAISPAPPSPRVFQDSLRQTRNPNCESVDKHKGNNSSAVILPPHRLACLQELIALLSSQVNIPLLYKLNFEEFPQFHHVFPCMIRHQGVSPQSPGTVVISGVLQAQGMRCERWK